MKPAINRSYWLLLLFYGFNWMAKKNPIIQFIGLWLNGDAWFFIKSIIFSHDNLLIIFRLTRNNQNVSRQTFLNIRTSLRSISNGTVTTSFTSTLLIPFTNIYQSVHTPTKLDNINIKNLNMESTGKVSAFCLDWTCCILNTPSFSVLFKTP